MAWSAVPTYTTGQVLTAANLNTYLRDNMAAVGGTDKPMCRAFNSAVQAITTATETAITMDSERFDTQAIHSTVSNTSRMTIPTGWGGVYLITGSVQWTADAAGTYRQTILKVNAATFIAVDSRGGITINIGMESTPTTTYAMAAGDYVELRVKHDKGSNLNTGGNPSWGNELTVVWQATG